MSSSSRCPPSFFLPRHPLIFRTAQDDQRLNYRLLHTLETNLEIIRSMVGVEIKNKSTLFASTSLSLIFPPFKADPTMRIESQLHGSLESASRCTGSCEEVKWKELNPRRSRKSCRPDMVGPLTLFLAKPETELFFGTEESKMYHERLDLLLRMFSSLEIQPGFSEDGEMAVSSNRAERGSKEKIRGFSNAVVTKCAPASKRRRRASNFSFLYG